MSNPLILRVEGRTGELILNAMKLCVDTAAALLKACLLLTSDLIASSLSQRVLKGDSCLRYDRIKKKKLILL